MKKYNRRRFLKQSGMLAATIAASHTLLPSIVGESALNSAPARPLEILALGDSVMWGQGLREEQKFYTLTQKWLEGALGGRAVNSPTVRAHSGARILPEGVGGVPCHGEVSFFRPTIHAQIDDAARKYQESSIDLKTIDLILMNGGINDFDDFKLIQPFISKKRIIKDTSDFCYVAMKDLLRHAAKTFCNARIVVTGYFPLISGQTTPDTFVKLFLMAFGPQKALVTFGTDVFNKLRNAIGLENLEPGPVLNHAAEVSDLWYTESTLSLQRAVKEINDEFKTNPQLAPCDQSAAVTSTPSPLNRRIVYAHPVFKCENAYGAPETLLFQLISANKKFNPLDSPIDRLTSNDYLVKERAEWCKCKEAGKRGLKMKICERAGTAHPNERGAREYGRAITTELATILPFTGWAQGELTASSTGLSPIIVSESPSPAKIVTGRGFDRPFFAKAPNKNRPEVIAHRGGDGQWPGETMFAYKRARDIGVDVLEMDVYLTLDNELVLMHDENIKTRTKGTGIINKFKLGDLQRLNAAQNWSPICGEPRDYSNDPDEDLKVTSLKAIFDTFPEMRMNIEMKKGRCSPARKLSQMIREHNMTEKVLVASFEDSYMHEFRRLSPEVATSASSSELIKFKAASMVGAFYRPDTDAIQVKDKFGVPLATDKLVASAHCLNMKPEDAARCLKLPLHVWTVNKTAGMEKMITMGVDGIITDCPGLLLEIFKRNNLA